MVEIQETTEGKDVRKYMKFTVSIEIRGEREEENREGKDRNEKRRKEENRKEGKAKRGGTLPW